MFTHLIIINYLYFLIDPIKMEFTKVCSKNDLESGKMKIVEVNGEQICLSRVQDQFFAISNTCSHQQGPLGEGELNDDIVTCPWHGWQFNVKTGKNTQMPVSVEVYEVKLEGDDILISNEPKEQSSEKE